VAQRVNDADPLSRYLVIAVFVVIVCILTLALYIVTAEIGAPAGPRTLAEKNIEVLRVVVREKPKVARAWADYAHALIGVGDLTQAARVLDDGARAVGDDAPEILLERARLASTRGATEEALGYAERAVKAALAARKAEIKSLRARGIVPNKLVIKSDIIEAAAVMMARVHVERAEYPAALTAFDLAHKEGPTNADTLVERGYVRLRLGDPTGAAQDFRDALEFAPDHKAAAAGLREATGAGAQ
jgi:Flp pilus assembly protein TadD